MKNDTQSIIVVGMHRSGTSALTGALQCLGVNLGGRLYSRHRVINDKGYFEHAGIADTNDEALAAMGSSWDSILPHEERFQESKKLLPYAKKIAKHIRKDFLGSRLWAVKDPRVCRLLPWWLEILSSLRVEPCFLFIVRSPFAVYQSLRKRDGFSADKAYLLWLLHYLEAERWSRGKPRTFVDFDLFLEKPIDALIRVEQELGVSYPRPVAKASKDLAAFLDAPLRHHRDAEIPNESSEIALLARDVYLEFTRVARIYSTRPCEPYAIVMDEFMQHLKSIQESFPQVLVEHIRSSEKARGKAQLTLWRLVRSWSWYTGKPVRFFERLMGRDV